jgi:DNA-binding CsgD family transcriptional regulator
VGAGSAQREPLVIGREADLAGLREFIGRGPSGHSLVLTGGPGIGKTTLWEAAIAAASESGLRVLSARSSSAEAQLSFAALIDLCDGLEPAALAALPAPQRSALEVALLRAQATDAPPGSHAIALGFLNCLRMLSAGTPLLIALDDVQWLDAPSAEVLEFVARRLEREPIAFLLAKRAGPVTALERALERGRLERREIGPLSVGATRRLLSERLGLSVSRQLLLRITDVTLGNPLFAIELGRALVLRGLPEPGEDIPLPGGIEEMLGTRVASLPSGVRRILVAVALSADIRVAQLEEVGGATALDDAVESGVLVIAGDRVRAAHPLLAAAAKTGSRPAEQRELHLALAGVVADLQLRALHLALATERFDGELAMAVAEAAAGASARGARQQAVALAEHALRLTPPAGAARPDRVLALGRHLEAAGEMERLTALLAPELPSLPAGTHRARAWLLLAEGTGPKTLDELEHHRNQALAESDDDPGLRAYVLAKKAATAVGSAVAQLAEAEAWALEALAAARGGGADLERLVLYGLAWPRVMTGRAIDDLCGAARTASDASAYIAASPERVAGQRLVWRGEVSSARSALTRLLTLADERGERESYAMQRLHMCELLLRVGDWDAVAALLDEWAQSSDRELMFRPKYERCRALLAAGRGEPDEARRWALHAIALAESTGSRWDGLEGLRALGIAELLAHEPAAALTSLRAVWEHTEREGVLEPGVFPAAPELVEALAELGELDEAVEVTAHLAERSRQQRHPWGNATAERCDAVVRLSRQRYDEAAAAALGNAVAAYERLGLRFDAARSLLSLGRAQRRFKQWGGARRSLEAAAAIFDGIGSPGWVEQSRSELTRVGARRPRPSGELTDTERRAGELAAQGLSNAAIARELFVTVHTVEVHLSRAYAKLGISSRGQLAGRLATGADAKD